MFDSRLNNQQKRPEGNCEFEGRLSPQRGDRCTCEKRGLHLRRAPCDSEGLSPASARDRVPSRYTCWCLRLASKAQLSLAKYHAKYAGKYRQKYRQLRTRLYHELRLSLDLDLNLNLNLNLNPLLYRELFAKTYQSLFQ